jgi:ribosomal protein L7/L12
MSSYDDEFLRIAERLRTIESNLRRALQQLNLEWQEPSPTEGIPDEVVELVRAGDRIAAVKAYREITGASLGESNAVVQAIVV